MYSLILILLNIPLAKKATTFFLSFFLSLSVTYTHTYTHTQNKDILVLTVVGDRWVPG